MASRKPQQRTVETRAAIMQAASRLFAKKGYAATGVREVAEMAGCNQALVSYHFGGKSGLYDAVLLQGMKSFVETAAQEQEGGGSSVHSLVLGFARAFSVTEHFVPIMLREYLNPERMLDPQYGDTLRRSMALTEKMISMLPDDARARQFDPQYVHMAVLAPMILFIAAGPVREAVAARDATVIPPELEDFARQLADMLALALE